MSIKKKFVTAITTAGLLAGLFGSAFVPSALAARTVDADASYAFMPDQVFNWDPTALQASDGEIGMNSDGGPNGCWDANYSEDCKLVNKLQISSYVDYGKPNTVDGDNNNSRKWGSTGDTYWYDYSIGFVAVDDEGDLVTTADLSATVSGGKIKVAFAYTENNDYRKSCADSDLQAEFGSSDAVSDALADDDYDAYYLCIKAVSKTTLGTSGLTIKVDGVTVWSGTVQVIGDADEISLTVADGYNRVSANNAVYGEFFKAVVKDSAGQAIIGTRDGFNNDIDDSLMGGSELEYHARGTSGAEDIITTGSYTDNFGNIELEVNACVDADAGDTKSTAVKLTSNQEGDRVTSNSVSIICTGDADEYVVSSVSQEYSSPVLIGAANWGASAQGKADATGQIDIYAVLKDQDGALMGVDGSTGFADFDGDYSVESSEDDLFTNDTDDLAGVGVGGKYIIGGYDPVVDRAAKFKIVVTIDYPDNTDEDAGELVVNLYYQVNSIAGDYTLTRVRNAAKTSATWTADWGVDCSNAVVYFDWVNKNGTKGTLVNGASPVARRANFDGVATFTLKKRNMTIFVTAFACDDFSDSPDELGPVKARFR